MYSPTRKLEPSCASSEEVSDVEGELEDDGLTGLEGELEGGGLTCLKGLEGGDGPLGRRRASGAAAEMQCEWVAASSCPAVGVASPRPPALPWFCYVSNILP